jgi:hypothetical protein
VPGAVIHCDLQGFYQRTHRLDDMALNADVAQSQQPRLLAALRRTEYPAIQNATPISVLTLLLNSSTGTPCANRYFP